MAIYIAIPAPPLSKAVEIDRNSVTANCYMLNIDRKHCPRHYAKHHTALPRRLSGQSYMDVR